MWMTKKTALGAVFFLAGLLDALVFDAVRLVGFVAQAAFAVGFVFAVGAGEEFDLRVAFKGEDVRSDAVEESAVVRDDERGTGEGEDGFFQRAQGFDVQIVGWFVQE